MFCYECHEELLHNPVLLKDDLEIFSRLVRLRGLDEEEKSASKERLGRRIELLHEAIALGLRVLEGEKC